MRTKHTFRLPPDLASQLADYAGRKRVPQALIVEAALASYLRGFRRGSWTAISQRTDTGRGNLSGR